MTKVIQLSNLMNNRIKLHRISTSDRERTIIQHNTRNRLYPTKGQILLVLLWDFAEFGNRKALRLKAQGVYFCK